MVRKNLQGITLGLLLEQHNTKWNYKNQRDYFSVMRELQLLIKITVIRYQKLCQSGEIYKKCQYKSILPKEDETKGSLPPAMKNETTENAEILSAQISK